MMIKALMEAWEREPVRFEGDVTMVWMRQTDGSHKLSVFHASHLPPAAAA
jgi:hypothetical protein